MAYSNNLAINFSNIIDAHIEESMNERARIRILAHESGPSFTQTAPSDPMADSKDRGRTFCQIVNAPTSKVQANVIWLKNRAE